ncbi:probable ATP-dependent RNA helicase DDX27 [Acropora millepora]|uniref:probable ATP-dependent RNA helicase DDX27 n=1 Tax=Acropora millepora TaxID=45264 RepID=UPI001CF275C8|nr:probable ATP-dependent RNA helicase DDX27 [Acropora millepora]
MAALPFVGTLDSDEEVQQVDDETESEDEQTKPVKKAKKKKKGKSDVFQDGFNLFSGETEDGNKDPWNFDAAINLLKKRQISTFQTSLQDKIAKRRDDKRKRKNAKATEEEEEQEDRDDASGKKQDEQLETEKEIESRENGVNHTLNNNDEDNENNEGDDIGSEESSSEDDEKADKVTEKKKKFFQEPPPQVMHESFSTMNLSRPLLKAINDLGFIHPTPIQASTIPLALLGKDICACAATGTGKTAAYMLPILERLIYRPQNTTVTRVLVLAPTRELAIQVHSVSQALAKHTNIQICLATGGLDSKNQVALLRRGPDIVIATPGRLVDHLHNAPTFSLHTVEIIVLDEADRMLDENFQDQMEEIIKLSPGGRQTMLFSATMTDEVEELANLSLNQPVRLFVDNNTDVAYNLRQEFVRIRNNRENDRLAIVTALCSRNFDEHCLIFMQTKHSAHRLRIILGLLGLNVEELHGNLTQLQRLEALRKFKEGQVDILVATDLASRGLDILGVKTVINTTLPPTLKQYIHRVGRTARAGRSGRSISLVGERERKLLKDIVKLAKTPVKSRIVPPEVIDKYKSKIEGLEKDVKAILKQEGEEKELRVSEIQMNKARNLIEHEKEIFSRPPRVWIQSKRDTKRKAENANEPAKKKSKNGNSKGKKTGNENEEERKARKEMEFLTREAKRSRKNKKLRAFPEDKPNSKGKGKSSKSAGVVSRFKAFDKELTDTSKNALKAFRQSSRENDFRSAKKGSSGFKSKKRYKRR